MKYAIGLDIGIASVGYAVLALDHEENPWGIIRLGSRIFDVAENPKDGASLALPRREARSVRRRLRRQHHRLERIKNLLINTELITKDELLHLYDGNLSDVYELRVKALDYSVTNAELTRILLHLAQRRGFKSNRKADANDKEAGQLLEAVSANTKRMQENHYRTVGEMFYKVNREGYLNQSQIARKARNHAGCGLFLRLHYFQKVSTAHRKSATYVTSMQHICNTYVTNYIKFIASNSCSNVL